MPTSHPLDLAKLHASDYTPPSEPTLLAITPGHYLTLEGIGEPGGEEFQAKVQALYGVAYTLKMTWKHQNRDFKMAKLEALWWSDDATQDFLDQPPETWRWKLLLRMPDFIDASQVESARAKQAAQHPSATQAALEPLAEGESVQALHVGPYATEAATLEAMRATAQAQGYELSGRHHEIYLSDPRRTAPDKLRTLLRYPVRRAAQPG